MGSMRVWKKRAWESKNLEKNRKNQKKQFCMDLPKILLTELFFFFLVFFEFLDNWAWESKKPREKQKNKKTKKQFCMDLPKILLTGLFFLFFVFFFWFSSSFWAIGLGRVKNLEKNKKTNKTILHGLTQDSSHRIVFFGFLRVFGQLGLVEQKTLRKTKKTKKNNFAWTYARFFPQDCFFFRFFFFGVFPEFVDIWKAGNGKKGEKQNVQKPNAPSVAFC